MNTQPILIIGNKGKTGSRVEALLNDRGIPTRGVSRSTSIAFDWEQRSTWSAALANVRAAYVCYQPDLAVPQAQDDIKAFIEHAKLAEVEHIVLLSGRGEAGAERAEQQLINSGLHWNVVRASWFNQNFTESFMAEGIQNGELALPAKSIPEPFVDVNDIAEVALAALTNPKLKNRLFEVTGPYALTFEQCVSKIAKVSGRDITFKYVPIDDYLKQLESMNLPEGYTWLFRELFIHVLDGRNSEVQNGVKEALGREAISFDEFANSAFISRQSKIA